MILNSRPAKIGGSINSRSERHGEEDIPAMDIPITAIMLPKAEVNALRRDKTFWDRHFDERSDGFAEPADVNIKPFQLTDVYEHSTAHITVGLQDRAFTFEDCKIVKLKLTPCAGGLTELQLTIQVLIDNGNTELFEYMAKDCSIELTLGELEKKKNAAQPELPLDARGVESATELNA